MATDTHGAREGDTGTDALMSNGEESVSVEMRGRVIVPGSARGRALVSLEPIGFLGGVDPDTGIVTERGHRLEGRSVASRVLVFPCGKGSTVGSYTLYRLATNGLAPVAILNEESEAIVAVGAIISDIPMVDQIDAAQFRDGDTVTLDGEKVVIQRGHLY